MCLYHKGDLNSSFKDSFMSTNPECNSVDTNGTLLKKHSPTVPLAIYLERKSEHVKDLRWITHDVKKAMINRKKLYDHTRQCDTQVSWYAYRKIHNKVFN